MKKNEIPVPLQSPKKIWEIAGSFKCALIGTCLNRGELRKLSKERVFAVEPGCDDYQLHSRFIRIADQCDQKAKILNKYLEKKYRTRTKKYRLVAVDEEIKALWAEDLAEGKMDSAWWAVVTHPRISIDLVAQFYGQIHMSGHDYVADYHSKQRVIAGLNAKIMSLEERKTSERQRYLQEKDQFQNQIAELKTLLANQTATIKKQNSLLEEFSTCQESVTNALCENPQDCKHQAISELEHAQKVLNERIDTLSEELGFVRELYTTAVAEVDVFKVQKTKSEQLMDDQAKEIASLESFVLQNIDNRSPCLSCAAQCSETCPGLDLCGRTVLYVGGLQKMVPHYRQLVESSGGYFIHHDGGKEVARNLLPKMLSTADAVLCPIDCISHDACNCAKKICKRYQKPFVLMRSASLSSLAKGLSDIAG